MNFQHLRSNEALREKLAAEYVLGTLRGGARRRFEQWLRNEITIQRAVAEWQDRLHPLAELAPAARPSSRVWLAIEQRLGLGGAQHKTGISSRFNWWTDLRLWRGLGIASTAFATILVAVLLTQQPAAPAMSYVATLADDKAQPVMVVVGDAKRRQMTIRMVAQPNVAPDRSLELWAVPKEGSPRSLGLVAANDVVVLPLPEHATPQSAPLLAITLEPRGGSPNPAGPTGPILFKGAWLKV